MKKKFKKQGFTLVELLVVIAILATLASVSVIGYLHFTKKAEISNDTALATQLNTILAANEVEEGKNKTMHDAVLDLNENGITSDKLHAMNEKDTALVWDQDSDRFLVLDTDNNKVLYKSSETKTELTDSWKFWKTYEKLPSNDDLNNCKFSTYLSSTIDQTSIPSTLTVNKGFDTGALDNKIDLTYNGDVTNAKIRLNAASNLDINNEKAHVEVYNKINDLNVINASKNTVVLYASVKNVSLIKGHLDLKNKSTIDNLTIKAYEVTEISLTVDDDFEDKNIKSIKYYSEEALSSLPEVLKTVETEMILDNANYGIYLQNGKLCAVTNSKQDLDYYVSAEMYNKDKVHMGYLFFNGSKPSGTDYIFPIGKRLSNANPGSLDVQAYTIQPIMGGSAFDTSIGYHYISYGDVPNIEEGYFQGKLEYQPKAPKQPAYYKLFSKFDNPYTEFASVVHYGFFGFIVFTLYTKLNGEFIKLK